jgi:hypothetical protein
MHLLDIYLVRFNSLSRGTIANADSPQHPLLNQSISQPINQSTNVSTFFVINQSVNQSISQKSISQSTNISGNQSISQPINQSTGLDKQKGFSLSLPGPDQPDE